MRYITVSMTKFGKNILAGNNVNNSVLLKKFTNHLNPIYLEKIIKENFREITKNKEISKLSLKPTLEELKQVLQYFIAGTFFAEIEYGYKPTDGISFYLKKSKSFGACYIPLCDDNGKEIQKDQVAITRESIANLIIINRLGKENFRNLIRSRFLTDFMLKRDYLFIVGHHEYYHCFQIRREGHLEKLDFYKPFPKNSKNRIIYDPLEMEAGIAENDLYINMQFANKHEQDFFKNPPFIKIIMDTREAVLEATKNGNFKNRIHMETISKINKIRRSMNLSDF